MAKIAIIANLATLAKIANLATLAKIVTLAEKNNNSISVILPICYFFCE